MCNQEYKIKPAMVYINSNGPLFYPYSVLDIHSVDINRIVISDKLKHSDKGTKYFIGDTEDNVIRRLCVVLPQMSGFIRFICY